MVWGLSREMAETVAGVAAAVAGVAAAVALVAAAVAAAAAAVAALSFCSFFDRHDRLKMAGTRQMERADASDGDGGWAPP
jgi:hypothetical protein